MSTLLSDAVRRKTVNRVRFFLTERQKFALITVVNLMCFFLLWELVAVYSGVPRIFLPRFSSIVANIPEMLAEGVLLPNLWVSVGNFVIGVTIGVAIGLPLAIAVGGIRILDRIVSPYLWALFSMPRIILVPLIFLWLGINNNARLAIVIISALPSLAVVVMEGVKTTDATLIRAARAFGANRRRLFLHVIMPATLPFLGTGLRMAMLRGLIGLFVGELFITADGLGSILAYARVRFDIARVFAVLLIFVAIAVLSLALTRYVESKLTIWRAPARL